MQGIPLKDLKRVTSSGHKNFKWMRLISPNVPVPSSSKDTPLVLVVSVVVEVEAVFEVVVEVIATLMLGRDRARTKKFIGPLQYFFLSLISLIIDNLRGWRYIKSFEYRSIHNPRSDHKCLYLSAEMSLKCKFA